LWANRMGFKPVRQYIVSFRVFGCNLGIRRPSIPPRRAWVASPRFSTTAHCGPTEKQDQKTEGNERQHDPVVKIIARGL
jgi:hypothetical protein